MWAAQAHLGCILYAASCHIGGNVRIVLTACATGTVKSWIVHHNGNLTLCTFFNSTPFTAFTSISLISPNLSKDTAKMSSLDKIQMWDYDNKNNENGEGNKSIVENADESNNDNDIDKYFRVLCLCGDINGKLDSWILSSDQSATLPLSFSRQISSYPTQKLHKMGVSKECEIGEFEFDGNTKNSEFMVLSLHSDGTLISLLFAENGSFKYDVLSPFSHFPFLPKNFFQLSENGHNCIYVVGENKLIKLRNFDVEKVTVNGNRNKMKNELFVLNDHNESSVGGNFNNEEYEEQCLLQWEQNEIFPDNSNRISRGQKIENGPGQMERNYSGSDFLSNPNSIDFFGESLLAVENIIQIIRKDRKLLQLFRQIDNRNNGFILRKFASRLIQLWLNIDISKLVESSPFIITSIFNNLSNAKYSDQKMKFLDIVRISSLIYSEYKKIEKPKFRKKLEYRKLKSSLPIVTYGVTGERVLHNLAISNELHNTPHSEERHKNTKYYDTIEMPFLKDVEKSPQYSPNNSQIEMQSVPESAVYNGNIEYQFLQEIPVSMQHILEIVNMKNTEKFRLNFRRTIRICRTILDMRGKKHFNENMIHDFSEINGGTILNNGGNGNNDNDKKRGNPKCSPVEDSFYLDNIPELILDYFVQNFGATSKSISQQRIFKFLEAIIRYSAFHPVIKALEIFLFYDDDSDDAVSNYERADRKIILALYINSRAFILSRGFLVLGSPIGRDPLKASDYLSGVAPRVTNDSSKILNCQLVSM